MNKKTLTIGTRVNAAEKERIDRVMRRLKRDISSGVYEAVMERLPLWETQAEAQELASACEASRKKTRRQNDKPGP